MDYQGQLKRDTAAATKKVFPGLINALPPEILTRFFLFTVESRSCPLHGDDVRRSIPAIPKYPDLLLFVCSRWHDVAISTRSLWSHIDIVLSCPQSETFLARAKVYVARAEQASLDIHIIDPGIHPRYRISWGSGHFSGSDSGEGEGEDEDDSEDEDEDEDDLTLQTVSSEDEAPLGSLQSEIDSFNCLGLNSEPTRIRSLELAAHCKYHMSQLIALKYYLSRCAPDVLTELLVLTERPDDEPLGYFIEYGYVRSLDVPAEDLEKSFRSLTALCLKGLYPYWTSQAYHGLVDLHLGGGVQVPEQRLIDILKSSPSLLVLRLDCQIIHPTAWEDQYGEYEGEPPFDVHLKNLEILDIHSLNYESTTTLLRRLSYGPKPLRLCLSKVDRDDNISHFLIRSENLNVTELRIDCATLEELNDYLDLYPGLHTLVIGEWDDSDIPSCISHMVFPPKSDLSWYSQGDKSYEPCLDTLYVIRTMIPYNELRVMVDYFSVRRLVLWGTLVRTSGSKGKPTDAEMAALCPVVENLDGSKPNPVEQ